MDHPDFKITSEKPISSLFVSRGITDFKEAMRFVTQLPYGRNKNKSDLRTVFSDNCGTCGTKHALLKQLADENDLKDLKLMIGIFRMNAQNTSAVKATLEKHKLAYIPEAHNYLRYREEIIDCMKENWSIADFKDDILEEIEITPEQITTYKVDYHKKCLEGWIQKQGNIPYSLDELWRIREQCIRDLSN